MSGSHPSGATEDRVEQVARLIDPECRLSRTWQLEGGVSAQVTALEIVRTDGCRRRLIMRRHGKVDFERNPRIAAHEFRLLNILHSKGLRTQTPVLLDESCRIFPSPFLVVEYIEGEPEFAPADVTGCVEEMARLLASIHRIDDANADLGFLPVEAGGGGRRPVSLDNSIGEERIRDALDAARPFVPANGPVLLHGDYWPGNILWQQGRLAGVIDWEDARVGDPLFDLANGRLEILWAYGEEAMQHFTGHYRSLSNVDFANLPYWDLCAALRPAHKISGWALDEPVERRMRKAHALFVDRALQSIANR
jgi:aminoglycoside phosphotransferase (APT) family kinase protein